MLEILLFLALGATVIVLLLGIAGLFSDAPFLRKHNRLLMRLRVLFQGLTLLIFAIILMGRQ